MFNSAIASNYSPDAGNSGVGKNFIQETNCCGHIPSSTLYSSEQLWYLKDLLSIRVCTISSVNLAQQQCHISVKFPC